jgi:predicted HTH domain antitoxin
MSLVIPDELVQASGFSEDELLRELMLLLFQRENISLGKASCILGLTQLEFQTLLADHNLSTHYGVEELYEDVQNLQFVNQNLLITRD